MGTLTLAERGFTTGPAAATQTCAGRCTARLGIPGVVKRHGGRGVMRQCTCLEINMPCGAGVGCPNGCRRVPRLSLTAGISLRQVTWRGAQRVLCSSSACGRSGHLALTAHQSHKGRQCPEGLPKSWPHFREQTVNMNAMSSTHHGSRPSRCVAWCVVHASTQAVGSVTPAARTSRTIYGQAVLHSTSHYMPQSQAQHARSCTCTCTKRVQGSHLCQHILH